MSNSIIKSDLWNPAYLELIPIYRSEGMTYLEIANKIGVSLRSIHNWKKESEELYKLCKKADESYKKNAVSIAEKGIIKRANGFEATETKQTVEQIILGKDPNGKDVIGTKKKQTITKKNIAPDVDACKTILKNYDKENWSENSDDELEIIVDIID